MNGQLLKFRMVCVCLVLAGVQLAAARGFAARAVSGPAPGQVPGGAVMLTAVSRDVSVLSGGISTGIRTPEGTADVEQIAWITPSGAWRELPCNYHWLTDADLAHCRKFASTYLSRFHRYTIVSPDGYGATVQAPPSKLDNCYAFGGRGVYTGQTVVRTAIAASNPTAFEPSSRLRAVQGTAYPRILAAFAGATPVKLHTLQGIRLYRLSWNGLHLIVAERSFTDFSSSSPSLMPNVKLIFSIGEMRHGKFHILFWKQNTTDDNEQLLGTIRLKSGKQFLVTSINTPQAQFFRAYALRNGIVQMVFSGGGATC